LTGREDFPSFLLHEAHEAESELRQMGMRVVVVKAGPYAHKVSHGSEGSLRVVRQRFIGPGKVQLVVARFDPRLETPR